MISIQDFSFTYKGESQPALQDICLSVPEGGFLGVIGPAGAGKTTLARAVSGMIPHHYTGDYYGSVKVNGMDTVETSLEEISRTMKTELAGLIAYDLDIHKGNNTGRPAALRKGSTIARAFEDIADRLTK